MKQLKTQGVSPDDHIQLGGIIRKQRILKGAKQSAFSSFRSNKKTTDNAARLICSRVELGQRELGFLEAVIIAAVLQVPIEDLIPPRLKKLYEDAIKGQIGDFKNKTD